MAVIIKKQRLLDYLQKNPYWHIIVVSLVCHKNKRFGESNDKNI